MVLPSLAEIGPFRDNLAVGTSNIGFRVEFGAGKRRLPDSARGPASLWFLREKRLWAVVLPMLFAHELAMACKVPAMETRRYKRELILVKKRRINANLKSTKKANKNNITQIHIIKIYKMNKYKTSLGLRRDLSILCD